MAKYDIKEINFNVVGARVGIIAARFNWDIVGRLLDGATSTLEHHGLNEDSIDLVLVPGAFEIPLAAQRLATSGRCDAVITLGAVIRGGTPHFEYVAGECARGVSRVALDHGVPVIFGVLTLDNMEQALARAGGTEGNKGSEAALAGLEMISALRGLPAGE